MRSLYRTGDRVLTSISANPERGVSSGTLITHVQPAARLNSRKDERFSRVFSIYQHIRPLTQARSSW